MVEDILLHRLHAQHAHDHFEREVLRQHREHPRRVVGLDLRQHDGHRLRVFVLQVIGQHRLVDVAQLVPHGAPGGAAHLLHDLVDPLFRQGAGEKPLGGRKGADQAAGRRQLVGEFHEQALDDVRRHRAQARHRLAEDADFLVVHALEQYTGLFLAQGKHEDRRLLGAR